MIQKRPVGSIPRGGGQLKSTAMLGFPYRKSSLSTPLLQACTFSTPIPSASEQAIALLPLNTILLTP